MKTVLFEHHHLYYLPQFLPVMIEMQSRKRYDLFASISNEVSIEEKDTFSKEMKTIGIPVIESESEIERRNKIKKTGYDIIIIGNNSHVDKLIQDHTFLVMIYHGIGLKESYYTDMMNRVNLRAVESEQRYNDLKLAGEQNLILSGFTKLDGLQHQHVDKSVWLNDHNLNPDNPTILYAPTFYPSSVEKTLPIIRTLTKRYNFIIKLHQFSWTKPKYKHHIDEAMAIEGTPGIFIVPENEYNILPFFQITDGLITDISSVLFEYLAIDRPIIQTTYFSARRHHRLFPWILHKRIDHNRFGEVDFTHLVSDPCDLTKLLDRITADPDEHSQKRKAAKHKFLYKTDYCASKRLIDAIEKIV